jgi:hypothetical protein
MVNRILGNSSDVTALNELHYLGHIWDTTLPSTTLSREKALASAAILLKHIRRGLWGGDASNAEISCAQSIISKGTTWTHRDIYQQVLTHEMNGSSRFVTDQTPRNVFFVTEILELFPQAKIIHMIRDPRAVLASQRNRWKTKWLGGGGMPLGNAFRMLANYHPYTLSKLWAATAKIADSNRNQDRYRVVIFEQLVSRPDYEVEKICRFIGIEYRHEMLAVPQIGSSNKLHATDKIGVTSDVIDAWKNNLPEGDVLVCEHLTRQWMKRYGYIATGDGSWSWRALMPALRFPFHVLGAILANPRVIYLHLKVLARIR